MHWLQCRNERIILTHLMWLQIMFVIAYIEQHVEFKLWSFGNFQKCQSLLDCFPLLPSCGECVTDTKNTQTHEIVLVVKLFIRFFFNFFFFYIFMSICINLFLIQLHILNGHVLIVNKVWTKVSWVEWPSLLRSVVDREENNDPYSQWMTS